ncbi:MAG TPA: PSD1 and planctomycete cytochrome C domain-containing protein, partial [Dongiaceae bacterium]|nr:PSD1 and planctomycete cytochrome C domain-containing protein [Dongiaceae bacterium]
MSDTRTLSANRSATNAQSRFSLRLRAAAAVLSGTAMLAAGAASPPVQFNRDIRPILSETCFPCHGFDAGKRKAELRLDTLEGATAIHKGRQAVKGGDLEGSEMWRRISSTDPKSVMPPPEAKRRLKPAEMGLLRQWIESGAVYQRHWAFEPPVRPELPAVKQQGWARNEVDYFILAALESKGLEPAPEAAAQALVRRVTLDLTGLPPTPGEVDAYLADQGPKAYERWVDRLLESPRYGEQMARYWLDVARYGDTHGMHIDNERAIWAYRDWVVGAFNRNLPFDQFTTWQLAGDLLPNPSREQLIASGFNRCNLSTSEGGAIDEEFQVRYAVDRVATTSTTWLGLTMGCAACHDHKFDPISQREFYQMCAIFNNISENAMDGNALLPPPSLALPSPEQDKQSEELAARASQLQKELDQTVAGLAYTDPATLTNAPHQPGLVSTNDPAHDPSLSLAAWEKQQRESGGPSKGPKEIKNLLKKAPAKLEPEERRKLRDYYLGSVYADPQSPVGPLRAQLKSLQEKREALEKEIPATLISRELDKPRPTWVRIRGQYDKHGDPVGPGVPGVLPPLPAGEATNRLTLARWLTDPKNPLPARVTVNRFWQQFFGVGIVKTSEDFGARGEWPSHPELLDWLASEFIRSGWDVKQTVRRLVTSGAYRQDSRVRPELRAIDPENRLLARGPRYRLDAEELRDYALCVSGLLNLKMGGRGVRPYQPPGIWEAVGYTTSNTAKYSQDHGDALYRRSLYTFWKRTAPPPSMTTLDAPTREQCWARRERTDTPLQALLMMNDPEYFEAARQLGYRMWHEGGADDASRLAYGFKLATARPPAPRESAVLMQTLAAQRTHYGADADAARKLIAVGEWP